MSTEIYPEWLSEEGIQTLSDGYLLVGETPRDMFIRVAKTTAKYLPEFPEIEEEVFDCLWNGYIGLASPVAANFGTNRGLPISCYSVHLDDSVSSIYSHLKEVAHLSKNGGGVGVYFGDVRPSGAPISAGGVSTGVVPWAQQYDLAARVVSQGGVRRGSFAMYLPIDHPDVPELLRAKDHSKGDPRKFIDSNVALTISDKWIEEMIAGDTLKQELFGEVLRTRLISGSPYLIFIDNVNRQNPKCYHDRNLTVKTSNLCVSGDTKINILDECGNNIDIRIDELSSLYTINPNTNIQVRSYNTETKTIEYKKITAFAQTSPKSKVIKITDEETGKSIVVTPDHEVYTKNRGYVMAKDLLPTDELVFG